MRVGIQQDILIDNDTKHCFHREDSGAIPIRFRYVYCGGWIRHQRLDLYMYRDV
jgi:hypothetical protein